MLHDLISKRIAWPILRFQQRLRPSRRAVAAAGAHAIAFRSEAFSWPDDHKKEWLLERLKLVLQDAGENSPYYRDLFSHHGFDPTSNFDFSDFNKLPVLERHDVLEAKDAMISTAIDKQILRPDSSGGSTGEPTKIWVGPEEEIWHSTAREYFMRQLGIVPGSRIAYLWGHHLDPVKKMSSKQVLYSFLNNERWFDCFRLGPDVLARYHSEMERYKPDCIVAYASALAAFAEYLNEHKLKPSYPRTCIVTGAEKLYDVQREVAEKVFRKPIHERYGSRDAGMMGFQLDIPHSKDFTVDWPNLLIEPETSDLESSILVTKLHADGMPMIRYRIGDVGLFPGGAKPGHPVFRLRSVVGRTAERIWLPNGSFIHGIQFPHLFKDFPVRDFMVVQDRDFGVEVKIVPSSEFSKECHKSILNTIEKNLPGLRVTIKLSDSIPRTKANKWRPVLSHASPIIQGQTR
ncbi:MAG TPA: hypothetical protein VGJ33_18810 [Candidatus Angelobacter sp.]|jgi:phenylacetate-CoA ligase